MAVALLSTGTVLTYFSNIQSLLLHAAAHISKQSIASTPAAGRCSIASTHLCLWWSKPQRLSS
jgi:hypothetical protein